MQALALRVSSMPRLAVLAGAGGALSVALVASRTAAAPRPPHSALSGGGGTSRRLAAARAAGGEASPTSTTTLKVEGMVCSKCTARVEKALVDAGMEVAKADLATGMVKVSGPGADAAALAALVTGIGFPAVPAE